MRVLVTGGKGFLGHHVVEQFRMEGIDPYVLSKKAFNLVSPQATSNVFHWVKPDVVVHLAAEVGGIGANQKNPGRFFYANMQMGLNVLEACRVYEVKKLVMTGTVCSYPKMTCPPFFEHDLWGGFPEETNAPYGIAKKALLTGMQAYRKQYGMQMAYLLPANMYGPRDNFDPETSHVIPAMIGKMLKGEDPIVLWGDGSPTREFLYVKDAAEAVVKATFFYDSPEPVNVGTGEEIKISELADLISDVTCYAGDVEWDVTKPNGQPRRALSTQRAKEVLGWEAKTELVDGLRETVDWFRYGE